MKKEISCRNVFLAATICVALLGTPAQAQFLWSKRIASTTNKDEESIGMALDSQGNIFVTGCFDDTNDFGGVILTNNNVGGQDIFVAKYNSAGTLTWAEQAGGSSASEDLGSGIGVDTNGYVYVTGGFYGPADFGSTNLPGSLDGSQAFFLAKYNSAGSNQWVRQAVGSGGNGEDYSINGTGLAVDGAGNCYAVGWANNGAAITFGSTNLPSTSTPGYSAFLVKFDTTGTVKWALSMDGSDEVYTTKVAVDAAGNVYVYGDFGSKTMSGSTMTIGTSNVMVSTNSLKNMFIAKFDNSGDLTWVQQPQGGVGNADQGGVALDQAGNVYVTGSFETNINFGGISLTNAGSTIAFVAKYSNSGAILWARQAGGTNLGWYFDVALDGQGNVYPAGLLSSYAQSGSTVASVAKYDPAGTLQWAYSANSPPASPFSSIVTKCAVDSAENCYLAGLYQGTATFGTNVLQPQGYWNFFLAKVAPPASPTLGIVLSNGFPQLSLVGEIGGMYSPQWSPVLAATNTPFQPLTTLTLTNSPQLYLDTSVPTGTNRFYRAGPPAF
jgi:hypothetical protein